MEYICSNCGAKVKQNLLKKSKEDNTDGWYYTCPYCDRVITQYDEVNYKQLHQPDANGYLELNKAIVKNAIFSWEQASRKLVLNPLNKDKLNELIKIETFFKSKDDNVFLDRYECDGILTKLKTNPYYRKFIYLYKIEVLKDVIKKIKSLKLFKLEVDTSNLQQQLDSCVEQYEDIQDFLNAKIQDYERKISKCMN